MAQLIHEIQRSTDFAPKLVGFPVSLDLMKVTRSRTLICVTDYIGSGRQALRYIDAWHRHPTIRSWRSYGYLKIAIFAFAATTAGLRAVRASPHVDIVEVTEVVPALEGSRAACRIRSSRSCAASTPIAAGWAALALALRDPAGCSRTRSRSPTTSRPSSYADLRCGLRSLPADHRRRSSRTRSMTPTAPPTSRSSSPREVKRDSQHVSPRTKSTRGGRSTSRCSRCSLEATRRSRRLSGSIFPR